MPRIPRCIAGPTGPLCLALLAGAGCAGTAPHAAAPLAPGVGQALRAADVYRPGPRSAEFVSARGEPVRRAYDGPDPQTPDRWTITTTLERRPGDPQVVQRVTVGLGPAGEAVLHALEQPGRVSTFDPPLVLLPASLGPGEEFRSVSTVASRRQPGDDADRGPAELTASLADPGPDAAGPVRLRTVMVFRLGPATVTRTVDQWFDAGTLRAEIDDRRVTVGPFTVESELRELRGSAE
jgi:hypothetical protein